mgnify:CR=1 FL=1
MKETLIIVDDKDNFIGYATREECHSGKGIRHRAFVILLFNKDKKILLQKRKHKLWNNYWDLTAASHPLHLEGRDETYEEAAAKCLKREWDVSLKPAGLKNILAFNYSERYSGSCENEHCALMVGEYSGKLKPDSKACYEYKWIKLQDLIVLVKKDPENFTPWLLEAVKKLKNHPFAKQL